MTSSKLSVAVGKHEPGKAGMWQTVCLLEPTSKWEKQVSAVQLGGLLAPANLPQDCAVQLTLNLFLSHLTQ